MNTMYVIARIEHQSSQLDNGLGHMTNYERNLCQLEFYISCVFVTGTWGMDIPSNNNNFIRLKTKIQFNMHNTLSMI